MDIRELEYFITVSELNNFTAAAERLHVSQPAISKAIHKLEEELGVHLLDRTQKKVLLTEEGTGETETTDTDEPLVFTPGEE